MNNSKFDAIIKEAEAAGLKAGSAFVPTPMIVGQAVDLFSNKMVPGTEEFVSDGVCGFAWVHFKGNTAFGRYMKKIGKADNDYPTGLSVWVHQFGQSMQKKEAYARAYAEVLRKYGIEAYANSRLD